MVGMNMSARKRKLASAMKAAGVDALLVTHLPDVRYLCGFTGSNASLAVIGTRAVLFTDGRYTTQAKAEVVGAKVVIAPKSAMAAACEWLGGQGVAKCGFDSSQTTVAALETMRKALPAGLRRSLFTPVAPLVAGLREIKDAEEIVKMRAAAALGCRLFDGVLEHIVAGAAEVKVAAALEYQARLAGVDGMSFETIVASGERSALPHGRATKAKLPRKGFCTLDFGVLLDGYCSDMTRTVHLGRIGAEERTVYEAVLDAQLAGVAAVRAGASTGDVDEAARSVLRAAKLDQYFTHSTGHGVGLEIHEGPRLATKQTQPLKAGMIVTIEPGVYIPGKFGVRIEDTVLVTATGCEILTPSTKALIEL
ncbi:Xaa-Pro aminopeptidase [Granulicella rosea]|uniref:Xaa-Pro aminopeptidase n=2 Tax=Granulicella rosea TaxID=474952 RepID=A0A239HQ17_9BACT|nr:Xaa-Pro aminopeptidase [Granulicella rosea]